MILQFLEEKSRSSAKHAGIVAALVCALGATVAGAQELSFDELTNELDYVLEPIASHHLSDDIVLAQFADDYSDNYTEEYNESVDDYNEYLDDQREYLDEYEEYVDEYNESVENYNEYTEDYINDYANNRGSYCYYCPRQ